MSQYLTIDVDKGSPNEQHLHEALSHQWASTPVFKDFPDSLRDVGSQADKEWFEDYPTRCIRMRYPTTADDNLFNGTAPKGHALVLIFCPTDGTRVRLPIAAEPANPPPDWLLSGDPVVDRHLAQILAPTLEETRRTWGNAMVDQQLEALLECLRTGKRLAEWKFP